jgi:hypothetical protein
MDKDKLDGKYLEECDTVRKVKDDKLAKELDPILNDKKNDSFF